MNVFVDTNVVVYAHDHGAARKQEQARAVLQDLAGLLVVSTQVLSEFYWVVTRKLTPALPHDKAARAVQHLSDLPVVNITAGLVTRAIDTAADEKLSLWDALIVEAAAAAGCDRILTEDLQHDRVIRGARIDNPFR